MKTSMRSHAGGKWETTNQIGVASLGFYCHFFVILIIRISILFLCAANTKRMLLMSLLNRTEDDDIPPQSYIGQHNSYDIFITGQWQRAQVAKFCLRHQLHSLNQTLPDANYSYRSEVYRHVIYDNQSSSLFCFMPKVGCTNIRMTFLIYRKLIPDFFSRITHKRYLIENKVERSLKIISFDNHKLTDSQRLSIIRNYKRFTILRHPLERLLSAYLDKLEGPILRRYFDSGNYFERLKGQIFRDFHPEEYERWKGQSSLSDISLTFETSSSDISLTFETFLRWVISRDFTMELNEHFMPQYYNCEPCRMDYHFYGNFENFSRDGNLILNQFQTGLKLVQDKKGLHFRHGKQETVPTSSLMKSYYSVIPSSLKEKLYANLSIEFDFYHSVFPQHKRQTRMILGLIDL